MARTWPRRLMIGAALLLVVAGSACAQPSVSPMVPALPTSWASDQPDQIVLTLRILLGLAVLSLAPALLMTLTAFTRIVIVLSFLRSALGTQQTPPNQVLVGLALLLTLFVMHPVFDAMNADGVQPYPSGRAGRSGSSCSSRPGKRTSRFSMRSRA